MGWKLGKLRSPEGESESPLTLEIPPVHGGILRQVLWPHGRVGYMQLHSIVLAASSGQALVGLLPFLLIFVVFYVLLIVPQQRQRKKTQEMLSNLKSGDRVVTSGGIYGVVMGFRDTVVQIQVANQVKIEVARSAIANLQPEESAEGTKKKS